jgi:diadenosine tetraphosphate (Ap4A) HIT family hydrolase
MSDCLFCAIAEHRAAMSDRPENRILAESKHFYAKAALGQLVKGYTLIVTKDHYLSLASIPPSLFRELFSFRQQVASRLHAMFGHPIRYFEHGAVNRPYRAGSCIDHAHLHVFPMAETIRPVLCRVAGLERLASYSDVVQYLSANTSYLYLEEGDECFASAATEYLPSQLIRKVVADIVGRSREWDWRVHPTREKVHTFVQAYMDGSVS